MSCKFQICLYYCHIKNFIFPLCLFFCYSYKLILASSLSFCIPLVFFLVTDFLCSLVTSSVNREKKAKFYLLINLKCMSFHLLMCLDTISFCAPFLFLFMTFLQCSHLLVIIIIFLSHRHNFYIF